MSAPDFETWWGRAFPDLQKILDGPQGEGPFMSARAELRTLKGMLRTCHHTLDTLVADLRGPS